MFTCVTWVSAGSIAIGAFLAALALLVLTGITLAEWVLVWFVGASATAYVACVAEVVVRRRHKTLAASGLGSTLFIAFGIAFLRQWGLAFNPDPNALSTRVDSAHPDLYFYLAAAAGAVTLLLLFAGTVLPGRSRVRRPPPTLSDAVRRPSRGARPGPQARGRPRRVRRRGEPPRAAAALPRTVARPAATPPAKAARGWRPQVAGGKVTGPARPKSTLKPPAAKAPARSSVRR